MRYLSLLFFFLAPTYGAGQTGDGLRGALLLPGGVPHDSLLAYTWFGLYPTALSGQQLRAARVRVDSVPDACSGNFKITAAQPNEPLFLIGGLPGLREGAVDTAYRGSTFLKPGDSLGFSLGSRSYTLTAAGTVKDIPYAKLFSNYELRLRGGAPADSTSALVVRLEFQLDNTPLVLWVGDLDRDAKPDIFLALPGGGYSRDFVLFVSSLARLPDRVTRVAHYYATDC